MIHFNVNLKESMVAVILRGWKGVCISNEQHNR